jgi:hypothetical protein
MLALYYGSSEAEFGEGKQRSVLGTYGVAAGGCGNPKDRAVVYLTSDRMLIAKNECGDETYLTPNANGSFHAASWDITGKFNSTLSAIMWSNDTQWIRVDGKFTMVGPWPTVETSGGSCGNSVQSPSVVFQENGIVQAVNECGNASNIRLNSDGSITAIDWGNLRGSLFGKSRLRSSEHVSRFCK